MTKNMRRIFTILMVSVLCLSLTGCIGSRRKKGNGEPNEFRGTNYTYDFVDYMSIFTYGEDGDGYLEITPRDINASMFSNEKDYIAVKKDVDNMNLSYVQGKQGGDNGGLKVSKATGLKNGDIVTISVKKPEKLNSDINVEDYEYVVEGLGQAQEVDLFSKDLVTFYATSTGELCYHIHAPRSMNKELVQHLTYNIDTKDAIEANKTILTVEATLDREFLDQNEYYTLPLFLAKHEMKGETKADKVLTEIINPVDYSSANQTAIEAALYDVLYPIEPDITKVLNLQQTPRQSSVDPFKANVFYSTVNVSNGKTEYWYREVAIHFIDNTYYINSYANRQNAGSADLKQDSKMLLDFTLAEAEPEEEVEIVVEEEPAEKTLTAETLTDETTDTVAEDGQEAGEQTGEGVAE